MIRSACFFVLVGALISACGSTAPRAPDPDPRYGAPVVVVPRDVRPHESDPCGGFLSGADLTAIGVAAQGRPKVLQSGDRGCDWRSVDGDRYLTLIVVGHRDVLVDTYRTRQYSVFQPTEVAGLPATREQSFAGSTTCTVTVGTASGQGFISDYTGTGGCDAALQAAERVVAALPPLPS